MSSYIPRINPLLGPFLLQNLFPEYRPAGLGECRCTGQRCVCYEPKAYSVNNLSRWRHINFINMDVDGKAKNYLGSIDVTSDQIEGHHGVGTWRLPALRSACASFLWRMWEMPELGRDRSEVPDRQVIREMHDTMIKTRRQKSNELKRYSDFRRLHAVPNIEELEPEEKRIFDEGDVRGDSLVTAWLDIRTRQLVMGYVSAFIWFDEILAEKGFTGRGVKDRQMEDLKNKKWSNLMESLELSVRRATICKNLGNDAFRDRSFLRAGWYYVEGVVALSPWYPSEYYMSAWEGKLTGLTDITFALALNLALACTHLGQYTIGQFACLSVVRHPFATNWITAKAWHIFHRNIEMSCLKVTRGKTSPPTFYQNQLIIAAHQRSLHMAQPEYESATPSEAGNFTVAHVVNSARMLGDFEERPDASEDIYSMHLRCWHHAVFGVTLPTLLYEKKAARSRHQLYSRPSPRKAVAAMAPEMTRIEEEQDDYEGETDYDADLLLDSDEDRDGEPDEFIG